jgi:hypothetical protein
VLVGGDDRARPVKFPFSLVVQSECRAVAHVCTRGRIASFASTWSRGRLSTGWGRRRDRRDGRLEERPDLCTFAGGVCTSTYAFRGMP